MPQRMLPSAIVVDIDGTVTDYERVLDWNAVKALREVEARDIPVITATGNVAPVTRAFMNFVGLTGPAVCENGGVAYNGAFTRKKLLANRAKPDRAVQRLRRLGFPVRQLWSDPWRESEVALQLNLDEVGVRHALRNWNLDIVSTRFALHIGDPGLNKLAGLRAALKFLPKRPRVRPQDVLAIGDSNNDIELFQGAGWSGAVANASERAKAAATYVARRKFGAGVREILRHHGVL